jgi:hypothetical protein
MFRATRRWTAKVSMAMSGGIQVMSLLDDDSNVGGIEFNRETVSIDIGL